jgi:hypothetical protein
VTSLFGRNPVATAVIGAALLAVGLTMHSLLMPWIGGALLVVGGVKVAARGLKRGPDGGNDEGRSLR